MSVTRLESGSHGCGTPSLPTLSVLSHLRTPRKTLSEASSGAGSSDPAGPSRTVGILTHRRGAQVTAVRASGACAARKEAGSGWSSLSPLHLDPIPRPAVQLEGPQGCD